METKSRYEIMQELEEKKSILLTARAQLGMTEVNYRRAVEKTQEDLKLFLDGKEINVRNIEDQLASIDRSLERINSQKK